MQQRSLSLLGVVAVVLVLPGCGEPDAGGTVANLPEDNRPVESPVVIPIEQAMVNADASVPEGTQEEAPGAGEPQPAPTTAEAPPKQPQPLPPPADAVRLSPEHAIWISTARGEVIIDGLVSQREALLEMFACTRNTKEHESIISADTMAYVAHAALMRLGANPGSPVQFEPEYSPPTGTEIEILLQWRDTDGKMQQARAQEWVRDVRAKKEMTQPFVFGGSGMWKDEQTGKEHYMAEGGDFICVSNFSTAMLDVPAQSTQVNEGLLFEAFTDRIPPLGTPVRMLLKPKLQQATDAEQDQPAADATPADSSAAAPPEQASETPAASEDGTK